MKFDWESEQENTISIPSFIPIQNAKENVLNASYTLTYPDGFSIDKLEKNITEFLVEKTHIGNKLQYTVKNIKAPEYEELNTSYVDLLPLVRFGNNKFALGGVKGNVNSWEDFGYWYYQSFLKDLDKLPEETILKMKFLTRNAENDIEKAKLIFDYVQNNTRYISVQVGLGGWKPFSAEQVSKLGYGDCKALTNYTKALLKSVNVNSFYTVIHADSDIVDINEKIISLQGNHVILTIPTNDGNVFLECTSQKVPFGYLGISTDNRKALVIKPDGAYFVETHSNKENENVLVADFKVDLNNMQRVKTTAVFNNKGSFYNNIFTINSEDKKEVTSYLKKLFSTLKDLNIIDYQFLNNKDTYVFNETIQMESAFIGSKMGNDYLITINPFFNVAQIPKKYKDRKSGFSIKRGKSYDFKTEFLIPKGYGISQKPEILNLETKFGTYVINITEEEGRLMIKEKFVLKSGDYSKDDYNIYQQFITDVVLNNKSKFIVTKI